MSYDISLVDENGQSIQLEEKHDIKGGTYAMGGTNQAWVNITYNYCDHFRKIFKPRNNIYGIRSIYGLSGKESISILENAMSELKDDVSDNYWESTEGNAKESLRSLLTLAKLAPQGIWKGD